MPANTPLGFPYPVGTDRVTDGDDSIRALAEAVEAKIGVWRSGTVVVDTPSTSPGTLAVTFPAGLFTAAPAVGASCLASSPMSWSASGYLPTPTGFQVKAQKASGAAATTVTVSWWAAQSV